MYDKSRDPLIKIEEEMMETVYTEIRNGLTINIYQDEDSQTPDEWEDDGAFIVFYRRDFDVRRDHIITETNLRDYFRGAKIEQQKKYHILPLSAYIHGGVNSRRGSHKTYRQDSNFVGAILLSKKEFKELKTAQAYADDLISEWNNYLSGNVCGFEILDKEGGLLDSCGGYFGDYEKGALVEARSCVDALTNKGETDSTGQILFGFEQEALKDEH